MSKPLGYYTSYTPGDDSLLAYLQDTYGATFEKISKREKLAILTIIASDLGCEMEGDCREEIFVMSKESTLQRIKQMRDNPTPEQRQIVQTSVRAAVNAGTEHLLLPTYQPMLLEGGDETD